MQWQLSGAVWHIYDNTEPPQTRTLPLFSTELHGPQSTVLKSPQRCVPQPLSWDPRWKSCQKTSVRDRCVAVAPWPSSWHVTTQTQSASWVGGAETSCCVTSTRRHIRSRRDSQRAWSNTETMLSSHPPTGTKNPAPRLWPLLSLYWVTVGGLA